MKDYTVDKTINRNIKTDFRGIGNVKTEASIRRKAEKIYEMNKEELNSKFLDMIEKKHIDDYSYTSGKDLFIEGVVDKFKRGFDAKKAILKELNETAWTSKKDIFIFNLEGVIRKDEDLFHQYRIENGWNNKIDFSELIYRADLVKAFGNKYEAIYENIVHHFFIAKKTSPEEGMEQTWIIVKEVNQL